MDPCNEEKLGAFVGAAHKIDVVWYNYGTGRLTREACLLFDLFIAIWVWDTEFTDFEAPADPPTSTGTPAPLDTACMVSTDTPAPLDTPRTVSTDTPAALDTACMASTDAHVRRSKPRVTLGFRQVAAH